MKNCFFGKHWIFFQVKIYLNIM